MIAAEKTTPKKHMNLGSFVYVSCRLGKFNEDMTEKADIGCSRHQRTSYHIYARTYMILGSISTACGDWSNIKGDMAK